MSIDALTVADGQAVSTVDVLEWSHTYELLIRIVASTATQSAAPVISPSLLPRPSARRIDPDAAGRGRADCLR